jgi:hypothetical protein
MPCSLAYDISVLEELFHHKDGTKSVSNITSQKIVLKTLTPLGKGKGKLHPRTGHEGPEGEKRYSPTLSLTSALEGGRMVNATPRPLYPQVRPGTYCIGGWVGPRASLDRCGTPLGTLFKII